MWFFSLTETRSASDILLNVFLAIAVDNLNDEDDDEEEGNGPENDKEQTDQTAIENGKEDEGKTNENETTKDEKWVFSTTGYHVYF